MAWASGSCAFAVEMFKTGESVIVTQRAFHAHFMLYQNDTVPVIKSILLLAENLIWNSIIPT